MAFFQYDTSKPLLNGRIQPWSISNLIAKLGSGGSAQPPSPVPTVPPPNDQQMVQDLARQRMAMQGASPPMGPGRPRDVSEQSATMAQNGPPMGPGRDPGALAAPNPGNFASLSDPQGAPPPYGPGRPPPGSPPPMGPGRDAASMGAPPPMGPGNLPGALQAPDGMQPGDDAPGAPMPMAKPSQRVSNATRTRSLVSAVQSGDPDAVTKAVVDPASITPSQGDMDAAMKMGGGPDAHGGTAGGPAALFPQDGKAQTPAQQQKASDDAHAADKSATFGQKFMGALANPDTQDVIQSILAGVLSNPQHPGRGVGEGIQMYQQLHLRRQERDQKQRIADREAGQRDTQIAQTGKQIDQQGAYQQGELGLQAGDQSLRRDQYAVENKRQDNEFAHTLSQDQVMNSIRGQQLALQQAQQNEASRHDRADESNSRLGTNATIARLNYETGKPLENKLVPASDPSKGSVMIQPMYDGSVRRTAMPDVDASAALQTPYARQDALAENGIAAKGTQALQTLDDTSQVERVLNTNPSGIGPSAQASTLRWLATTLGRPEGDPIQELRNLKAQGQLDTAMGMKGQRMTDNARTIIKQAVTDVDNMSPAILRKVNEVRRQEALADIQATDAYVQAHPERSQAAVFNEYVAHKSHMDTQGGPRSGVNSSGASLSQADNDLINKYLPK